MECYKCGSDNPEESNFCKECGSKLRIKCKCWVKKEDSYNCGESNCPGYRLFELEKIKAQETS